MTENFSPSQLLLSATKLLLDIVKRDNVPDPGEGFRGFTGLSPDQRRVLYYIEWLATNTDRHARERRAQAATSGMGEAPREAAGRVPGSLGPLLPKTSERAAAAELPADGAKPYIQRDKFPDREPLTARGAPQEIWGAPPANPGVPPDAAGQLVPSPPPSLEVPPPPPVQPGVPGSSGTVPVEPVKKPVFLKNAKVGEPYDEPIGMEGLRSARLEDAAGSGLQLDEEGARLTGIPTASGDFQLRLRGLLHGKPVEIIADLAVIPDPKSLWVSKPSDQGALFWKPDEAFLRTDGDLMCVAASKRGRSHAKDGGFRDDDCGLLASGPGGWHVAVVADGAGSARFSRRGSKVATESVLKSLPALLEEHLAPSLERLVAAHRQGNPDAGTQIRTQLYQSLGMAAFQAAKAVEDEAAGHNEKASAFATTLIVCVVRQTAEGWFIAGFSVGDGGAAVLDTGDGTITTLMAPDSGEYAGQTRFLHRSEFAVFDGVARRIFFDVRDRFTALMLMTDGVTDPKFPTETAFADPARWVAFWNEDLASAVDFSRGNADLGKHLLEWLDFWSPGNHDDRTLAVLVP